MTPQAITARADEAPVARSVARAAPAQPARAITLSLSQDLAALETEWRRFEQDADATVFQSYGWQSTWQRHIGAPAGTAPAIVSLRGADGRLLALLPLAVTGGLVRRLTFLGSDLADYNAPLLAPDFAALVPHERFRALWSEIRALLQDHAQLRHDTVELTKMPETVGAQPNPLLALDVALNPSGAHLAHLGTDWETYYAGRRSSATRRRDRTKRKKLAEYGTVRMVEPGDAEGIARTFETLVAQKSRFFAHMGVANIFARA